MLPEGAVTENILKEVAETSSKKENIPKKPVEEFIGSLPNLYKNYLVALEEDNLNPDAVFTWGASNPNMTQGGMFREAIGYIIEAEYLKKELDKEVNPSDFKLSNLRGYNSRLKSNFGPEGTASEAAIEEIRESVKRVIDSGFSKNGLKDLVSLVDYKKEY